MRWFDAQEIAALSPFGELASAIEQVYAEGLAAPQRGHYPVNDEVTLLDMPAWRSSEHIGVKLVTVAPDNPSQSLPMVQGVYVLFDARNGSPLAAMDAAEITARRTAATAALASRYLARSDASTHLVIGTGKLAPYMALACVSVRPVTQTLVYGRDASSASRVVSSLRHLGITAKAGGELDALIQQADIVTCVTSATTPVLFGNALAPGNHINLVGSYRPDMRESDDRTVTRSRLFVDNLDDVLVNAGDICQPVAQGVIDPQAIELDLEGLVRSGEAPHRARTDITLFKSVGSAQQDYAIANLVWRKSQEKEWEC